MVARGATRRVLAAYVDIKFGRIVVGQTEGSTVSDREKEFPWADELCRKCGHPFNPHLVLGYGSPPTEGWMKCPVEGCNCWMTWSMGPSDASSESVASRLTDELGQLPAAHRRCFEAIRVRPRRIPVSSSPGETVVVVAEHGGRLLYYSDVEEGWELAFPNASGGIDARGANQFTLNHLMWQLFGDPVQPS